MTEVVLYSRPGCHLCEVARDVIEGVRAEVSFDLREVDVGSDDALEREYGIRIPVVVVDGTEAFEYEVEASLFRSLLER
jgi:glutaredoxin